MRSLRVRLLLLSVGLLLALPANAVSLENLLERMDAGPEVKAARAEQQALAGERRERSEERGWSLFGGATAGRFQELEPTAGRVAYTGYGAQLGLRYPLLGTLRDRTEALVSASTAEERQKHQRELAETEQRLRLRSTYIDWWEAQQYRRLCRAIEPLASDELSLVRERARTRDLRTSEQMLLEQRWSRRLDSCQRRAARGAELRYRLESLSGVSLPADARAESALLPLSPAATERWQSALRQHPLMAQQRSVLEGAQRVRRDRWYHDIDADFTLAQQFDWRNDIPGTGTGLVAGLRFEVPLRSLGSYQQNSRSNQRYHAARYELDATHNRLKRNLSDALAQYKQALAETRDQMRQVELSRRVESERQGRAQVDQEGSFMALRLARVQTADAMHDFIRSWRNTWQEETQLRLLAGYAETDTRYLGHQGLPWPGADARGESDPVTLSQSDQAGRQKNWSRAVYVWNSSRLLAPESRQGELNALEEAGFDTLHLGLSARQLANSQGLSQRLRQLLESAHARNLNVTLLLGEPSWLRPDKRHNLRDLIQRLAGLDFDGLHLDLEVEQLGWPVPDERLENWLATVAMAQQASPWPISLVSHHRWFAPDRDGLCIPCRLSAMGVESVSLMIYTTNQASLTERATAIATHWPDMAFRIVQSAEADLESANSWRGTPLKTLRSMERDWRQSMGTSGITGIEWQDWRNYQAIPEEDQP